MSGFESRFESIEELKFHPVPRRPIPVVKAVSFDRTTAILGADGCIYTDAVGECVHYSNTSGRHADLFRCLKKLRVLSPKVIEQHLAIEKRNQDLSHKRWMAHQMMDAVKGLGLRLTKQQSATIEVVLGAEDHTPV